MNGEATTAMQARVDALAAALAGADRPIRSWARCGEATRDRYRRMARAAIRELDLT